jgi:hypothetical protein
LRAGQQLDQALPLGSGADVADRVPEVGGALEQAEALDLGLAVEPRRPVSDRLGSTAP